MRSKNLETSLSFACFLPCAMTVTRIERNWDQMMIDKLGIEREIERELRVVFGCMGQKKRRKTIHEE